MILDMHEDEIASVDGGLTAAQTVGYVLIGSAAIAVGGPAALVGGFLIAVTIAVS